MRLSACPMPVLDRCCEGGLQKLCDTSFEAYIDLTMQDELLPQRSRVTCSRFLPERHSTPQRL